LTDQLQTLGDTQLVNPKLLQGLAHGWLGS
jgi:hypothetical protein